MGVKNVSGLIREMDRNDDGKVTFNEFTLYMIYKHFVPHLQNICLVSIDKKDHYDAIVDDKEKIDDEKDFIDDEPIEDDEVMPEEIKEMNHKQQQA